MAGEWVPRKLTDLATFINGYAFKPGDWSNEGLPIVRIEQLKNPDAPTDHFEGTLPPAKMIDDGDLIFSWSASLFLRIWRHGRAALNQHLFRVVEHQGVDRAFLKSLIEFNLSRLIAASHGSTMQHITRKELGRFETLVPTRKREQIAIAKVLTIIGQAIENTERLIDKQQRIKKGLTEDLLTRGLDENGNLRSEQSHSFKSSSLGRIPSNWEPALISSVLAEPPKNGYSPVESNEWNGSYLLGLGCLTSDGFRPRQLKFAPRPVPSTASALLHDGDFLISRSNTRALVGLVGIFRTIGEPCIYPDLIVRLSFTREVCTEYMEQVFMSSLLRRQIGSSAAGTSGSMVKINGRAIRGFVFMKPPIEEQRRILIILKHASTHIKHSISTLHKLYSLQRALMQDLITGRKRINPLLEADQPSEDTYVCG